jgi:hypothetical protein
MHHPHISNLRSSWSIVDSSRSEFSGSIARARQRLPETAIEKIQQFGPGSNDSRPHCNAHPVSDEAWWGVEVRLPRFVAIQLAGCGR